jgi:hypothetical protein
MRVEKSTTNEVSDVLRLLGEKKWESEWDRSGIHSGGVVSSEGVDFKEAVRLAHNDNIVDNRRPVMSR